MDYYVIPPVSALQLAENGSRIFVLAHLWVNPEYRAFMKEKKAQGWFVTLDNSAAERSLVTEDFLIDVAKDLMPDEVVSPDVLFDAEATLYNLECFVQRMKREELLNKIQIFAVPQGATKEEWLNCYKAMLTHSDVTTIGFSKIAIPHAWGTGFEDQGIMEGRHACYDELMSSGLIQKPIHCLGAGDPREFVKYKGNPLMRSTDSCFTVWAGMCRILWDEGDFERIKTPKDYFEHSMTEEEKEFALRNIDFLKEMVK